MNAAVDQEIVIELLWHRLGSGEWTAWVTDVQTGTHYEAGTAAELEAVLRLIMMARRDNGALSRPLEDDGIESSADPVAER